jgi:hypothetical protein
MDFIGGIVINILTLKSILKYKVVVGEKRNYEKIYNNKGNFR